MERQRGESEPGRPPPSEPARELRFLMEAGSPLLRRYLAVAS